MRPIERLEWMLRKTVGHSARAILRMYVRLDLEYRIPRWKWKTLSFFQECCRWIGIVSSALAISLIVISMIFGEAVSALLESGVERLPYGGVLLTTLVQSRDLVSPLTVMVTVLEVILVGIAMYMGVLNFRIARINDPALTFRSYLNLDKESRESHLSPAE